MKSLLLSLILSLSLSVSALSASAFAADGKAVSYKSGDETVNGILYTPAGKGPFPALIVIHEFWGLNDWVKQQAGKLADQGYVALAAQVQTVFRGTTLRSMLLEAYGFWQMGQIALFAAIASFIGAALLLILSVLGLVHERRVPAENEVLAKAVHTSPVTA